MLYLTCTTITSVDLAHYGVSRANDCVSEDCGTNNFREYYKFLVMLINLDYRNRLSRLHVCLTFQALGVRLIL